MDNANNNSNQKNNKSNTSTNSTNNINNNTNNVLSNNKKVFNNIPNNQQPSNFNQGRNFSNPNGFNMQPNNFNRFNKMPINPTSNLDKNINKNSTNNDLDNNKSNNKPFDFNQNNVNNKGNKINDNKNSLDDLNPEENQETPEEAVDDNVQQYPNNNEELNDYNDYPSNNPRQQNRNRNNNLKNNKRGNSIDNKLNRFKNDQKKKKEDDQQKTIDNNSNNAKQNSLNNVTNNVNNVGAAKSQKTPSTANTTNTANKNNDAAKKAISSNKMANMANAASSLKNSLKESEDEIKDELKDKVKQQAKQQVKKKILQILLKYLVPILPYIGMALIVILAVLFVIFIIISVFSNESIVINELELNYCANVNIKWGEGEEENITMPSDNYIAYEISMSDFGQIPDKEVIKSLAIVYRTNLYSNSNNLDSNVCNFEVDQAYSETYTQELLDLVKETENKVFTMSEEELSELEIDEKFSYRSIETDSKGVTNYVLSQDGLDYEKQWVDENIGSEHIANAYKSKSFSPFAAWYLSTHGDENYHSLLYHFYDPYSSKGRIYNLKKLYPDEEWEGGSMCSDISLSSTSLEKEEFVNLLHQYSNTHSSYGMKVFAANAETIYDVSIKNSFNPEMVVIRAMSEGFSPGNNTNNYWGLGCTNTGGLKACQTFPSLDSGIVGFINNIKSHNYATVQQMMMKYAYIGKYWYNPGSSSLGGCYYFKHIREYLSEGRANEVESACASSNTCSGASCIPTTDEDQRAYAQWQVSKMSSFRQQIFNISADSCDGEGDPEETGDLSTLGTRVAKYAVDTYDSWQYSQENRHQEGYVDCSSMVARAYKHFNIKIYSTSDSSSEIYRWCEQNAKTVTGHLQAGDLIFYNSGSHYNSSHYKGIGHVEMYIGGNRRFGAHTHYKDDPSKDVSIKAYYGDGNFFCRPYKQ